MSLAPGTRLGPYEILSSLGAGGMGEVHRAHDTRLGRDVAIKALPEAFAADLERLARFEREAKILASLSHPNIAGILGLEEVAGARYLVLELVDGETLAERLARGALSVSDTIDMARQVAAALEAAHERGVVHRDLKPGNIMFTSAGDAKVLDFGLAMSSGATTSGSDPNLSHSPTLPNQATRAGVILGTAAYMSPEQARGKGVDRRTDIWSLGCVMYECLTGRKAFEGETVSDMVARILEREPDWKALPPGTPPRLVELLKRCLRKDARERQRDAGDVRLELEEIARGGGVVESAPVPAAKRRPAFRTWIGLALVAAMAAALTAALMRDHGGGAVAPDYEFTLDPPLGATFQLPAEAALSPDGQTLVCAVLDSTNAPMLAVRRLDRDEFRIMAGTEVGSYPFWSPDGRFIAFFGQGKLRRMGLDGSASVAITDVTDARGGSWAKDGTIVYAPTASGPVFKVSATGGNAVQITTLDKRRGEVAHRYPILMRDGRHFLYVAICRDGKNWICVGDVDGGQSRALRVAEKGARPSVAGWIATVEKRRVMVQRFDEDALKFEGEPREIAQCGIWDKIGDANIAADAAGTIVYQRELRYKGWGRWYDVAAKTMGPRLPREFDTPTDAELAPDQSRVATTLGGDGDMWLVDLEHPVPVRLTFFSPPRAGALYSIVWSPDSKRIAYALNLATDVIHVYSTVTSTDTTLFTAPGLFAQPCGWTPDERMLAVLCSDSTGGQDLWAVPTDNPAQAAPCLKTPEYELNGSLSPDGRWFACTAVGAGKLQVRIMSFPRAGALFQLTLDSEPSGQVPLWSSDGGTLITEDIKNRVIATPVSFDGGFRQGESRVLLTLTPNQGLARQRPDMKRLLIQEGDPQTNPAPLRVLTAWPRRAEGH
ncbi:MAG TPA: protein kinase [Candidatus Krumholzibacteria bacterium]|nr:protein kinase [Candidatus Krumholzibacteria bacterium]